MSTTKSKTRLLGIAQIKIGSITTYGGMPTIISLATVGYIVPNSAHIVISAPEKTDIMVDDEDTPDLQVLGNRKVSFEFATRDMGTKSLILGLNGTASGSTIVLLPVTTNVVTEKAVDITSKTISGKALRFRIPRASMSVGGDLRFARNDTGQLNYSLDILLPESSTQISPCSIMQV
jgi:hypothetical protein